MDFGQKKFFCEVDLFDLTSFFFWSGFFLIFWPTVYCAIPKIQLSKTPVHHYLIILIHNIFLFFSFLLLQVSWVRLRDINLLAINEVTNTKDKRIKAIHVPESDRWSLRIQDTQLSDDGPYECQVTSRQVAKVVHLKVLGK